MTHFVAVSAVLLSPRALLLDVPQLPATLAGFVVDDLLGAAVVRRMPRSAAFVAGLAVREAWTLCSQVFSPTPSARFLPDSLSLQPFSLSLQAKWISSLVD